MPLVAIIGAGDLGGALAHTLARRERVDRLRLIDPDATVAAGVALDIQQAGPLEPFRTRLDATADPSAALGAAVVVLARPARATWQADDWLAWLRRTCPTDRQPLVVCAAPDHDAVIARAVHERLVPRHHIAGSAPLAYVSGLRALIGVAIDRSPADIAVSVLGRPGRWVVAWSEATVGGFPLEVVVAPPVLVGLKRRAAGLWPPQPYALASAAARVVEAFIEGGRRDFACFVALDGQSRGTLVTSMPVTLGPAGVSVSRVPPLSPHEQTLLDNALGEGRQG